MSRALASFSLEHGPSGIVYSFTVTRADVEVTRRHAEKHRRSEYNTSRCPRPKARALWTWLIAHGYRRVPA